MSNTTLLSALGSRKKIFVSISFAWLISFPVTLQACAQWPCLWPDSNCLPAGATQSGNVFPGGNLWGGGTLYTPAHLPQRYLSWTLENCDGLPHIGGPLDSTMATYRNSNGTRIVGSDMYNLDGFSVNDTNSLPLNSSDPRWNPFRTGSTGNGDYYASDVPETDGGVLMLPRGNMFVFHISLPTNATAKTETHAWLSYKFLSNIFDMETVDDDIPLVTTVLGPGAVLDGWYRDPAITTAMKWGLDGFAVTFTNNFDSATFGIANISGNDVWVDYIQIAIVTVPEPSTWGLVALGGLVLVIWWRQRRNRGVPLTLRPQRRTKIAKQFRTPYR